MGVSHSRVREVEDNCNRQINKLAQSNMVSNAEIHNLRQELKRMVEMAEKQDQIISVNTQEVRKLQQKLAELQGKLLEMTNRLCLQSQQQVDYAKAQEERYLKLKEETGQQIVLASQRQDVRFAEFNEKLVLVTQDNELRLVRHKQDNEESLLKFKTHFEQHLVQYKEENETRLVQYRQENEQQLLKIKESLETSLYQRDLRIQDQFTKRDERMELLAQAGADRDQAIKCLAEASRERSREFEAMVEQMSRLTSAISGSRVGT